ncbi:MAG: hypothetical protein P8013_13300 [Candidatus Sulfobium sp.]|jgi:hypothetical protein
MKKKYLIKGLLAFIVFIILVWGKVLYMQRSHFLKAEQYFAATEWKPAIREYDSVLHAYSPWSPYIGKSAERLWTMGKMFEKEGKPEWAVDAFSAIRSSFYASRSLYTPGKDWIEKCDDEIAELDVQMLIREGSVKPEDAASEKARLLYTMKADRAPAPGWSVVVEASFFGWVASVVFMIFGGFDEKGIMRARLAFYGFLGFILSFALWVVSLLKA